MKSLIVMLIMLSTPIYASDKDSTWTTDAAGPVATAGQGR